MRKLGSILCFAVAIASIVFAFLAGSMKGWFVGLAFFRTIQQGTFMGMIGNIFGVIITAGGFAATGYFGLSKDDKKALIGSALMCGVCLLSLIVSIFSGTFTIGDILIIAPCAMILISLFKD